MPYADNSKEKDQGNYAHAHHCIKNSKNNINFGLLENKEHPIDKLTERANNQLLIVFKNGRFEVLPSGISGNKIKDYLGIRFYRIRFWTAMPAAASPLNPVMDNLDNKRWGKITSHNGRDIYEH